MNSGSNFTDQPHPSDLLRGDFFFLDNNPTLNPSPRREGLFTVSH